MNEKDNRIQAIMELLMSYARLDFEQKIELDEKGDELTAIAAGVNMLGEELKEKAISLMEKERLLKELHHRVKNNMQIIVSLMKLQSQNETDPKIIEFVRDAKSRIDSMALVHEVLYSSEAFEFSSFKEYVSFLQRSVFLSYAPPSHEIKVEIVIPTDCQFGIDKMIPLGLILNELFSNSLKHAFPEQKGLIEVEVQKLANGQSKLIYSDNGKGIPKQVNLEEIESMGMQLIFMLSDQLDATIEFKQSAGLGFQFSATFV